MNGKLGRFIGILTLLIFGAACSPANKPTTAAIPMPINANIGDGGLITSSPCGPPCFFGIQPDITRYDEVMNVLSANPDLKCSEVNSDADGGDPGIQCGDSFVISFDPDKKLVAGLGYHPAANITVQKVMDQFGDPSNIVVETGGSAKTVSTMRLFYLKYRMSIVLDEQEGDSFLVSPDSKVRTVTYEGEKSYQALTVMPQSWSGYGKYLK